jgi:hypothetical protein
MLHLRHAAAMYLLLPDLSCVVGFGVVYPVALLSLFN